MKLIAHVFNNQKLVAIFSLALASVTLAACSSALPLNPSEQSRLAIQTEQLEKLKSAEYQDYMTAMSFEDSNQKLGNYYATKGAQVHGVIDEMEQGRQISSDQVSQVLDTSDAEKYDDRPPVPLDDETGNGY
jgi:hypothetical protein